MGQYEIVELLLQAGADRTMSYQNLTPLLTATQKGHIRIVQLLMTSSSKNVSLSVLRDMPIGQKKQVAERREVSAATSSVAKARSPRSSASLQVYEETAGSFSQHSSGEKAGDLTPSAAAAVADYPGRSIRSDIFRSAVSESKSAGTGRQKNSTSNANFMKGNDNFAAHKWQVALDYYKRALKEVELESENHYLIVGNMMQIYHGNAHGVKAKPDKVVKYARILEAQDVHLGMQGLSYLC